MTGTEAIKQGVRVYHYQSCTKEQRATGSCGCGDSWLSWMLLPGSMSDEEVSALLEREGWVEEGCYGGPGRPFCDGVHVKRQGSRILVSQRGGLDV